MKVVISFITFNCLKYTKICFDSIKCSYPHEILVIDNGSIDGTVEWLKTQSVTLIENKQNLGVPYCSNTMYDYTWATDKSNLLVVLSNDMLCFPDAIDNLIRGVESSDALVVSGDVVVSPIYLAKYPEDRRFFAGGNNITTDVSRMDRWSPGKYYSLIEDTKEEFISTLYTKLGPLLPKFDIKVAGDGWYIPGHRLYRYEYFDKLGYWDANFYPLYAVDYDYAIRARLLNQKCFMTASSLVYEFWSRVLYEGSVSIRDIRRDDYLKDKWGTHLVGTKGWDLPFNGNFPDKYMGYDTSKIKIDSREGELERVEYLMNSNLTSCADTKISGVSGENFYK